MRAGLDEQRVVAAAAELADTEGLEAVTVSAVARGFGVRPPSLYSHVASTADLRTGVALLALAEMADRAAVALAGRARRDALVALCDVYRDYAHAHPGRYAAAQLPLDTATARGSAGPRHAEMALAVLRAYDVPEPDRTHAVRLLGATVRGFVELELAGSFDHTGPTADGTPAPDAAASWRRTVDALDTLFTHWETR